jgi:hypothetical protein
MLCCGSGFAQWTDLATGNMKDTIGKSSGSSWADIDGDGDDDLILGTNGNGPTYIFLNDGSGGFKQIGGPFLDGYHAVWAPLLGDYDNDGDQDLFTVGFGEQCYLLENQGGTSFVDVPSKGLFENAGNLMGRGGAWVDYDADGLLDVMVATNAAKPDVGRDKLYRNTGGNMFIDASPDVFDAQNIGRGLVWTDLDNDGDVDLYAAAGKGCPCEWETQPADWLIRAENQMFSNAGGVLTNMTDAVTINIDHARGVAAGDYDNDGDMDLYICNIIVGGWEGDNPEIFGGYNKLLRNDGDFVFVDVTPDELVLYGNQRSCSWVDTDNDGDLDLLVVGMDGTSPTRLFENINDGELFVSIDEGVFADPLYADKNGVSGSFSDYDQDGDMDLFMTYRHSENRLLRNDLANGNHWIEVDLDGVESNRDGVGARITVTAGGRAQIRDVLTGTGYWSQDSKVQHFGLGPETEVSEIEVRWPSGITQIVTYVAADQRISIEECEINCTCDGDSTGDGHVGVNDLLIMLSEWGPCDGCVSDLVPDGEVDIQDVLMLIAQWGACP